jgi:hypothetical protein
MPALLEADEEPPAPEHPSLTPNAALRLALADASRLPPEQRYTCRYLYSERTGKALVWLDVALQLHVNLLNHEREIYPLSRVAPGLWRVDCAFLRRGKEVEKLLVTWEAASRLDPHFHQQERVKVNTTFEVVWPGGFDQLNAQTYPRGKYPVEVRAGQTFPVAAAGLDVPAIKDLRELLFSEVPILHAQWFIAKTCRQRPANRAKADGFGYYDLHGIKNRADAFRIAKLNIDDSKDFGDHLRAALEKSGVNPNDNSRQIASFQGLRGPAWVTLDSNDTSKGNLATERLPEGTFVHKAEEWFLHLSCGLPLTLANDDKGALQEFAPADSHGFSDTSPLNESTDTRIHVNLACLRCHLKVIQIIPDSIREMYLAGNSLGLTALDYKLQLELRKQYLSNIDQRVTEDQGAYIRPFAEATTTPFYPRGLTPPEAIKRYAASYHQYADRAVTAAQAAAEIGETPEDLIAALRFAAVPAPGVTTVLDLSLSRFAGRKPLTLSRGGWEVKIPSARAALASWRLSGGGKPR